MYFQERTPSPRKQFKIIEKSLPSHQRTHPPPPPNLLPPPNNISLPIFRTLDIPSRAFSSLLHTNSCFVAIASCFRRRRRHEEAPWLSRDFLSSSQGGDRRHRQPRAGQLTNAGLRDAYRSAYRRVSRRNKKKRHTGPAANTGVPPRMPMSRREYWSAPLRNIEALQEAQAFQGCEFYGPSTPAHHSQGIALPSPPCTPGGASPPPPRLLHYNNIQANDALRKVNRHTR